MKTKIYGFVLSVTLLTGGVFLPGNPTGEGDKPLDPSVPNHSSFATPVDAVVFNCVRAAATNGGDASGCWK